MDRRAGLAGRGRDYGSHNAPRGGSPEIPKGWRDVGPNPGPAYPGPGLTQAPWQGLSLARPISGPMAKPNLDSVAWLGPGSGPPTATALPLSPYQACFRAHLLPRSPQEAAWKRSWTGLA